MCVSVYHKVSPAMVLVSAKRLICVLFKPALRGVDVVGAFDQSVYYSQTPMNV